MTGNRSRVWNFPNLLTFTRVILAIVMFIVIPFEHYWTALILFLIAAATDWLDGWWARKFDQVSQLGRIMDPLADKIIVCGAFIYLVAIQNLQSIHLSIPYLEKVNFGLAPWMVVVIVLRELLVTVLRSFVENSGGNFSAKWIGKWKMGLQCVAVPACFLYLIYLPKWGKENMPGWLTVTLVVSICITVFLTLYSGIKYTVAAIQFGSMTESDQQK